MEARNFHTSLMGFRKKDVIAYLAEEKRQQEQQLEELRRQARELEEQLEQSEAENGAGQQQIEELQKEAKAWKDQAEALREQLSAAQGAQALAEQLLDEARQQDRDARLSLEGKIDELQARLELAETAAEASCCVDTTAETEVLRNALEQEKQRCARLEEQLACQAARPAEGETKSDQLWALCGKMERTIRQMETMLDGPYRMTCYPDVPDRSEREEPIRHESQPQPETQPQPAREAPAPKTQSKPSVSSLLQRVRGKS